MGQPYVGEIRMFAGNFPPNGWMFCNGDILPISENDTLFNLIGTTYGGDGQETFALPNLQSRIPIHMGTGRSGVTYQISEMAGVESVTLNTQQIPVHSHPMLASNSAGVLSPTNAYLTTSSSSQAGTLAYNSEAPADTPLNPSIITPTGGNQPHENCQPFLAISYIISLYGIYPSPT